MSLKSSSLITAAVLQLVAGASHALDGVGGVSPGAPADLGTPRTALSAGPAASMPRSVDAQLRELQSTNEFQRRALSQLHERVAAAEDAAAWLPWLGCALVGTLALSGWLAFSLVRSQRRLQQLEFERKPSAPPHTSVPLSLRGVGSGGEPSPVESPWPAAVGAPSEPPSTAAGLAPITDPHLADTRPLSGPRQPLPPAPSPVPVPMAALRPPAAVGEAATAVSPVAVAGRPVSVEELLDLEQQVDFFIVLGQQDAAIDLLVGHIRATGGTSPLPYLKLLEIYQLQGNTDDYERTRSRFNQRFSAEAPAAGAALDTGRGLEQYPEVVNRLQALWPLHDEAVRELDMLMRLTERGHCFDMPAFRELLLLHSVACDLQGRSAPGGEPSDVDILLPLFDEPADVTTPQSHVAVAPKGLQMLMPRPPEDLLAEPPASISATPAAGSPTEAAAAPAAVNLPSLAAAAAGLAGALPTPAPRPSADAAGSQPRLSALDALAAVRARAGVPEPELGDEATLVFDRPLKLDLDLSEFAPAPREYTQPAAFTDMNLVRPSVAPDDALLAAGGTPAFQGGKG